MAHRDETFWRACADEQRQIAEDYAGETRKIMMRIAEESDCNARAAAFLDAAIVFMRRPWPVA